MYEVHIIDRHIIEDDMDLIPIVEYLILQCAMKILIGPCSRCSIVPIEYHIDMPRCIKESEA